MSKNISTTSDDDLETYIEEFGLTFKGQEDKKMEKRESFDDLVEKAALSHAMTFEQPASKKKRLSSFVLSLIALNLITFGCLYYLYLKIENLETITPPENFNPPYSEEEIIIPLKPVDLYKKTSFPV